MGSNSTARPWSYVDLSNGGFALVDDDDLTLIEDRTWRWKRERSWIYVVNSARGTGKTERLHRFILGVTSPTEFVDHINGNGLDNRRSNLRVGSNRDNQRNRFRYGQGASSYKGVTWHAQARRWQSQIKIDNRSIYLGLFTDEVEAALAYDRAALEAFGDCAAINFPEVAA